MPQGMSQWACAIVVGRSQLVRRDMGLLASRVLVGGPGDLVAGVGTGGHGRSGKCRRVPRACQTWQGRGAWPRVCGLLPVKRGGAEEGASSTPRSAGQLAFGRRSGEGADPGEQLALGEWAALFDFDASLATATVVIRADMLGEMLDYLAVTQEQQVIVDWPHVGDLGEEGPHGLVAMALAGWVLLRGCRSSRAVPAGDRGVDAVAHGELGAPAQDRGRVGGDPDTGGAGTRHRSPSFPMPRSPIDDRCRRAA